MATVPVLINPNKPLVTRISGNYFYNYVQIPGQPVPQAVLTALLQLAGMRGKRVSA